MKLIDMYFWQIGYEADKAVNAFGEAVREGLQRGQGADAR
jgi:hypothetical protein